MESEDGNLIKAATTLLKLLEVNVTKETVTETVRVSPEYPSISSVSKSFSKWGIANVVAKLESHQFTTLLPPFITHLRQENKESFVVVTRINDEQIEYFSDVTYPIQNSLKSFLNEWTGVVLLAEANEYSGEKNYKRIKQNHQFRKIRKLGVFLGIFILVSLAMVSLKELWVIGIFALHLIGATACIILLIKDSGGILATKIQKVCNFIKEINCDNVTNSRAGALFNEVKVSELGLIYFIGGSLVIASGSTGGLVLLYYFNLLILPYAVYMLFYQAFMIKQWCIFCLIINAIIWLTAALEYLYINYKNISFDNPLLFFFAFVVSTTLWLMIRPQIISSSKEYKTRLEIARFKSNPFIFQKLLENQPVVNIPTFSKEVMLGFSDALHQIVFVSNPHCPPCKEAFNEILKLKGMYENNIKVTFRFMGDISNPNHEINKVAQILISLADSPLLEKALDEWFRYKDFKTWSMKYHQGISSAIKSIHQQHLEWCEIAQVEYTPSIFINGRLLPDFYETEDLLAHFENILILHQVEV